MKLFFLGSKRSLDFPRRNFGRGALKNMEGIGINLYDFTRGSKTHDCDKIDLWIDR